ncbi:hypothetical protein [Bacillus sp. Marseille-P3800]|uniref:hypothetical protein n=1 Tax=Bacillus sp. Marseille-P3800 TaxID=2014782 RepID=UPI000C08A326|nr:hypothetical protein [Bacillus sp. Marseille-P3800]
MKYRLIGENDLFSAPINQILRNRGIDDVASFLVPTKENVIHHSKLKNMGEAIQCFLSHVKKGSRVAVVVDSDPD